MRQCAYRVDPPDPIENMLAADSASPSSYDWTDERAELSPWQWKRTVLELRLSFKRLSMRLRPGEAVESTDNSIDDFVASLLDRPLTQDQMALVDEAMKGIDVAAVNAVSVPPVRSGRGEITDAEFPLQLLKAGAKRLAAQLLSIIDSDDQERRSVVSQIRTVSTILALALNHSRRAGFHTRASSGGIADPSSYISSLRLLVGHLGKCDAQSQKSSDILETSFLTLRLYLAMVGDSPEMAAVSPQMTVGLLTTTNDLVKVGLGGHDLRRQIVLADAVLQFLTKRSLRSVESSGTKCAWTRSLTYSMVSTSHE